MTTIHKTTFSAWLLALTFVAFLPTAAFSQSDTEPLMSPMPMVGIDPKVVTAEALATSLLTDNDGDGVVEIAAFGDSITRGEGDFIEPNQTIFDVDVGENGAGYPLRIEAFLGLNVSNLGDPGEELIPFGVARFISLIPRVAPDIVVIGGGSNDARIPAASPGEYFRALQTMVNVSRAIGIQPIVSNMPPACCNHEFLTRFIDSYIPQSRLLAAVNDIPLADIHHAYANTCVRSTCSLLNRPEGLHPNIAGYDVMGEVIIAALLNINIFAPDGPTLLAQALNVPVTSIRTQPDPVAPAAPAAAASF